PGRSGGTLAVSVAVYESPGLNGWNCGPRPKTGWAVECFRRPSSGSRGLQVPSVERETASVHSPLAALAPRLKTLQEIVTGSPAFAAPGRAMDEASTCKSAGGGRSIRTGVALAPVWWVSCSDVSTPGGFCRKVRPGTTRT